MNFTVFQRKPSGLFSIDESAVPARVNGAILGSEVWSEIADFFFFFECAHGRRIGRKPSKRYRNLRILTSDNDYYVNLKGIKSSIGLLR